MRIKETYNIMFGKNKSHYIISTQRLKTGCGTLRKWCKNKCPQTSMHLSNAVKTSGPKFFHNKVRQTDNIMQQNSFFTCCIMILVLFYDAVQYFMCCCSSEAYFIRSGENQMMFYHALIHEHNE